MARTAGAAWQAEKEPLLAAPPGGAASIQDGPPSGADKPVIFESRLRNTSVPRTAANLLKASARARQTCVAVSGR